MGWLDWWRDEEQDVCECEDDTLIEHMNESDSYPEPPPYDDFESDDLGNRFESETGLPEEPETVSIDDYVEVLDDLQDLQDNYEHLERSYDELNEKHDALLNLVYAFGRNV